MVTVTRIRAKRNLQTGNGYVGVNRTATLAPVNRVSFAGDYIVCNCCGKKEVTPSSSMEAFDSFCDEFEVAHKDC